MTDEKPKKKRRARGSTWGTSRKMPSGRWQARYPDPASTAKDGRTPAPETFATKAEADAWLAQRRTEMSQGSWFRPAKGKQPLNAFAATWLANGGTRGELKESTRTLYADLLARHIAPTIGRLPIASIDPATVSKWYADLGKELQDRARAPRSNPKDKRPRVGTGKTRQAQAYRLLRGIMSTAARAGAISDNPCTIPMAGSAKTKERPFMSLSDFGKIVAKIPTDLRPVFYLALGAHLRLGELCALTWADVDMAKGTLRIERQVDQKGTVTTTKTDAARVIPLSAEDLALIADLTPGKPSDPLLTRANGNAVSRFTVQRAWKKAREAVGLDQFHVHDIRHTGLTMLFTVNATKKEVMARGGHSTTRAADIYQHIVEDHAETVLGDFGKLLSAARS